MNNPVSYDGGLVVDLNNLEGGGGVSSLNSLTGAVVLAAGTGVTLTPSGSNITIAGTPVSNTDGTITAANNVVSLSTSPVFSKNLVNLKNYHAALSNITGGNNGQLIVVQAGDSFSGLRAKFFEGGSSSTPGYPLLANLCGGLSGNSNGSTGIQAFTGAANYSATEVLSSTATGGTFTLTFGGQTTTALNWNATAAQVQSALRALSSIGTFVNSFGIGNVTCTGGPLNSTPITCTWANSFVPNPQATFTQTSSLTGGTLTISNNQSNPLYWAKGIYVGVPASGTVQCNLLGTAAYANEFAVYVINDVGLGSIQLDLMNAAYSTSLATVTAATAGAAPGATKMGFYATLVTFTASNNNTYTLTYCGQPTTAITYSSTAATNITNITNALSALSIGGTSLSGLVTVTNPSGSGYQIIISSNGGGTVPSGPSLTFTTGTGSPTAVVTMVQAQIKVTGVSGQCAIVPLASFINRTSNCFVPFNYNFPGTQMSAVITTAQAIFTAVWGDLKPALVTIDAYAGQVDSSATYQSYVNLWNNATTVSGYNFTDYVHIGFVPTQSDSDSDTLAKIAFAKPICESSGWIWFDAWDLCPGQAIQAEYGTYWTGDGTHAGDGFNQYIVSFLIRLLGFGNEGNAASPRAFSANYGTIYTNEPVTGSPLSGLYFSKNTGSGTNNGPGNSPSGRMLADASFGLDTQVQILQTNRSFQILNAAGTVVACLGTNNAVVQSFIPSGTALGNATGFVNIYSGSGAPAVSSPGTGAIYIRSYSTNGTPTTIYQFLSGAWTPIYFAEGLPNAQAASAATLAVSATGSSYIACSYSPTGTQTITLPAAPTTGAVYHIVDEGGNATVNNITISGNGNNISKLGVSASTLLIATNGGYVTMRYNGANWIVYG